MKSNLREFVQKFIEKQAKNSFPHLYIVDKQTGPFRKIQQAINNAQSHSVIKISEGFYEQNLIIKQLFKQSGRKPIRLEPKSNDANNEKIGVVLLINSGSAITVQLPQKDNECIITGIKISHSGNSQNHIKQQLMQHEHILNVFQRENKQIQQLEHQYVNRVSFDKVDNTILLIQKGKVIMQHCILSLNYLVKSCVTIIPAVCIQKQGTLAMNSCQIKGHPNKQTIGIISKLGTLQLQNSTITNHNQGGILIWGIGSNSSRIMKNVLTHNSMAIHAVGQQFKLKVYSNNISHNKIGIKVGLGSQIDINRNNITQNINGIQINSAFPIIYLNIIQKNQENGIVCKSYKKFYCCAEIKRNIAIVGNKKNGILIEGQKNKTKVIQNHLIAFNGQSGIKIIQQSFPLIMLNKIYKNYRQGILIVQKTNAVIQKNDISHNIQCNIALGGQNSHHTSIIENVISSSPGPGIILINSGRCRISRNDICQNYEGIIMRQSLAQVRRNYLSQNKNNGILLQQSSQPKIIQNFIIRNNSIGIFIRDQSGGNITKKNHNSIIHSNIIANNQIDVGLQEKNTKLIDQLKYSNTIQGSVDFPLSVGCQII